ncbi:hypothetical protein [Mycolicibacterium palauense]|uniref:hypothetical protein n=1 Tax=Mycolicibacterium palauense TaxID=2034511 RepID=UPI001145891D|nr:hypothetical protein [Mycolicibacterium palauense]
MTIKALVAAAMTVGALGSAGVAGAAPSDSQDQMMQGEDAMMMMTRAMYECMHTQGVPRAVSNDRGVMFTCDRF